ncbi:hypothetical protein [Pseudooctadecabacter sp.]|uniref:hypothetical protein n=1 Tax=Pseudooctadecabacter sp. TaxID=1966338 RepID=UPI0035C799F5
MTRLKNWFRPRPSVVPDPPAPTPAFGQPPWHPTHRHKKGGGYRLLGYGVLEADRSRVAIYDDAEGTVWVRDAAEFEDGRFTPVTLIDPDHTP